MEQHGHSHIGEKMHTHTHTHTNKDRKEWILNSVINDICKIYLIRLHFDINSLLLFRNLFSVCSRMHNFFLLTHSAAVVTYFKSWYYFSLYHILLWEIHRFIYISSLSIYIYIYIRGAYDKFPDFFRMGIWNCRRLLKIQYLIAIHFMRWLTNFYDFTFKWTATAAIGIHPTKTRLSHLATFKNPIWHFRRTICNKILFTKLWKNTSWNVWNASECFWNILH